MKDVLLSSAAALLAGGILALSPAAARTPVEQVIPVPGFADFLATDGDAVWATNRGRVERWSRQGKLAEVATPHPCGAMAIASGSLWVADCQEKVVKRIDLRTAKITAVIPTGIANPKGETNVVAGAGSVWVASDAAGVVSRIDPATSAVTATVQVDPDTFYLAYGFDALWAVSPKSRSAQKIDPQSNTVIARASVGAEPGFTAAGEGGVWVQEQGDGTVARIDPATGQVTGRVKVDATLKYGDIDAGGGKVWLRTTAGQTFVVVDPKSLAIVARVGKESGSGALRYTPNGVWTTAHDLHTLSWWSEPVQTGR